MKNDQKFIIAIVIGTVVLFMGILFLTSNSQTPQQVDQTELIGTAPHEKGASTDAAVLTIVEFSDFQCPACGSAEPVLDAFVAENESEVSLVYRHFPLNSIHPNARKAAVASEIAAEQGLFWEYHDVLFENQAEWSGLSDPTDMFVAYAGELEIDAEDFRTKLMETDSVYVLAVDEDQAKASELNLNSTPTLFYNGELSAGVPTAAFLEQQLVDARTEAQ